VSAWTAARPRASAGMTECQLMSCLVGKVDLLDTFSRWGVDETVQHQQFLHGTVLVRQLKSHGSQANVNTSSAGALNTFRQSDTRDHGASEPRKTKQHCSRASPSYQCMPPGLTLHPVLGWLI
jgi:hypothetical protein